MKLIVQNSIIIILISFLVFEEGHCSWNKIKQFNDPFGCAFFFDADNGLIGSGQFNKKDPTFIGTSPLQIFLTSDGGKSWIPATTPAGGFGRITSIYMKDRSEGYASIYSDEYSLWKTTDGGSTWFDFTQGNQDLCTSVFASKNGIFKTIWFGNAGGRSTDGGSSYSQTFTAYQNGSNGIDFSDDNFGVVTLGPGGGTWITKDGGANWNQGDNIPESWSVHALKGTQTFLALPEDFNSSGQTVFWSQNGGQNWTTRSFLQSWLSFTGDIEGIGNILYVQTDVNANQGLYRSDNLGLKWNNVGGPSNVRDTRFAVAGCSGQVVYAFDNQGGVWKTTDGGDGTLSSGAANGSILAFSQDSLYIETRYCQPITWTVDLINPNCDSLIIDNITIAPNPFNEFLLGGPSNGSVMPIASSDSLQIAFHTDSNVTRHTVLHIKAHSSIQSIDTTIILVAKHSTAPEPYLVDLQKTKVGDTVLVPVYIKPTADSFAIKHFSFHLSYDGDILTPAFDKYQTIGTLSAQATISIGRLEPSGILVTVNLPKPITQDSDLTKPLIYLRMGVTLSRYMSCAVRMDTFSISNSAPLPLCAIPEGEFVVDPQCGDSDISVFMLDGKMPSLFSVYPNPNSGSEIQAIISLPKDNDVTIEFIDGMGKVVRSVCEGKHYQKGLQTLHINTSSITSGNYVLRMKTSDGFISHKDVIIIR